jgi:osmotically-inducible protein OsmY
MTPTTNATNRSDAEIFVEARHALDERPAVPGTVRVYVDDAVVTLTGTVRRPFERQEAEEAVRPIVGVRRLVNDIVVTEVANAQGYEPPTDRS